MPGFLGDKQTNVVHHLANMKKDCKIVDVKINDKQYFDPDTLENAKRTELVPGEVLDQYSPELLNKYEKS